MPVKVRSRPEGPKDTNTTPPTGNSANLVMAEIDDEVDTTNVYTDNESDEETNAVELSDIVEDVNEQDYQTESGSESGEDTPVPPGYIPPTPPKPRGDDGAYRVVLNKDIPVDFTEYFTDSEDDDEGDGKKPGVDGQYIPTGMGTPQDPELYRSDTGEENNTEILNTTTDTDNKEN